MAAIKLSAVVRISQQPADIDQGFLADHSVKLIDGELQGQALTIGWLPREVADADPVK